MVPQQMNTSNRLLFRLNEDGNGPEILKEVLYEKGWEEYDEPDHGEGQWNLWWKTSRFCASDYSNISYWQRVNHCPKATGITRKDSLARLMRLQKALHGAAYDFAPQSFILPNDYRKLTQQFSQPFPERKKSADMRYWICKPADMSRGRGISVIKDISQLQYDANSVVQQYISRPYLICGHKFDIRLYVVVLSYHPLSIYVYHDGIARFSCEKYDLGSLENIYSHLTNTSINKNSTSYSADKVGIGQGSKWTVKQLRHYFHQNRVCDHKLWWKIISIINLTIIPQVSEVPQVKNCFELYGFDILVDENLKPWLLEVNFSPSLTYDCPVDSVKKDMISDLIDLLDYKPQDSRYSEDVTLTKPRRASTRLLSGAHLTSKTRPSSMLPKVPRAYNDMLPNLPNLRTCNSSFDNREAAEPDESEVRSQFPYKDRNTFRRNTLLETEAQKQPVETYLTPWSASRRSSANVGRSRKATKSGLVKLKPVTQVTSQGSQVSSKPWRRQTSTANIRRIRSGGNSSRDPNGEPVVGGFHRIYPFNMATAAQNLSTRQMVLETYQMLKHQLERTASDPKGNLTKLKRPASSKQATNIHLVTPFPKLKYTA